MIRVSHGFVTLTRHDQNWYVMNVDDNPTAYWLSTDQVRAMGRMFTSITYLYNAEEVPEE